MQIKIDEEFQKIIPPLKGDEFNQLETNIVSEGCRDPLIVWEETGLLLDGHNRYKICQKNNISFQTITKKLKSRDDAIVWIVDNQLGRRNLSVLDKVPIAERKRAILEERARARQATSGPGVYGGKPLTKNFSEAVEAETGEVRNQLAQTIGVSGPTYDALANTMKNGVPELITHKRGGHIGASTASIIASMDKEEQKRICSQGVKEIMRVANEVRQKAKISKEVTAEKKNEKPLVKESGVVCTAWPDHFATIAIMQLERIDIAEGTSLDALKRVKTWVDSAIHRCINKYHRV